MFDFAAFSNPDLKPRRSKPFIPPKVRSVHFDETKNYNQESVSLSIDENPENDQKEKKQNQTSVAQREVRPKLVVEKIKREEEPKDDSDNNEKVLTVETKRPKLYVPPDQYQYPYIYGYSAQYMYPPNYQYPYNYQYPQQYPYEIQYPNGLPNVQPPVGDQVPLNIEAPYLNIQKEPPTGNRLVIEHQNANQMMNQEYQINNEDTSNQQQNQTNDNENIENGTKNNENNQQELPDNIPSSSDIVPPYISIDPLNSSIQQSEGGEQHANNNENVQDVNQQQPENVQNQQQNPNNLNMYPHIFIDPYTGIPMMYDPALAMQQMQLQQQNEQQNQLPSDNNTITMQAPGLLVQKSLTTKPYIPLINDQPQTIIDPSGLSIEKPQVNKALKLQWLPPGVSFKEKTSSKEVIEKSGITITKASNIKYDHLVLNVKEKPNIEEKVDNSEEEHHEETNSTISNDVDKPFIIPPPPSMFKIPDVIQQPKMTQMSFMSDPSESAPQFISSAEDMSSAQTNIEEKAIHENIDSNDNKEEINNEYQQNEQGIEALEAEQKEEQPKEAVRASPLSQIKIIPRLDMVDSSTDISSAPGDQEEQMRIEHQAYQEILRAKQDNQTIMSPPVFGGFSTSTTTPSYVHAPISPFSQNITSQPPSYLSNSFGNSSYVPSPSNPFGQAPLNPFGFSQTTTLEAPKAPTFPFSYQEEREEPEQKQEEEEREEHVQPVFIQSLQDIERNKSQEMLFQNNMQNIPQNPPEGSSSTDNDKRKETTTSEFSSDVYGQLETDKSTHEEVADQNQQQESEEAYVRQPVIDNDIDDLLGIV